MITLGSGNVFADLGLHDSEERLVKARLASRILDGLEARGWGPGGGGVVFERGGGREARDRHAQGLQRGVVDGAPGGGGAERLGVVVFVALLAFGVGVFLGELAALVCLEGLLVKAAFHDGLGAHYSPGAGPSFVLLLVGHSRHSRPILGAGVGAASPGLVVFHRALVFWVRHWRGWWLLGLGWPGMVVARGPKSWRATASFEVHTRGSSPAQGRERICPGTSRAA